MFIAEFKCSSYFTVPIIPINMMIVRFFTTITLVVSFAWFAKAQNFPVGSFSGNIVDASRNNRSIPVEIYYPSGTTAGANRPVAAGDFPVIVIGHGFSMGVDAYANFWNYFVPKGYIIILPNTEVGPVPFPDHAALGADLNYCVNYMQNQDGLSNSIFFGKVKNKTAVFGHSMGGGCSFLAAGTGNPNITTLLGLASAETNTSAIDAAATITIPSLLFAGGNDRVAPPNANIGAMYTALQSSCKNLVTVTNASHCGFAENNFLCNFGEGSSCIGCSFIPRATQHSIVFQFMEPWLNFFLKEQCSEWTVFESRFNTVQGVTSVRSCNYALPTATATAQGLTVFCDGDSVDLNAVGTYNTYTWSNGNTTQNINVNQSGNYSVVVADQYNCKDTSNTIEVLVNNNPIPQIAEGIFVELCGSSNTQISLTNNYDSFLWSIGETTSSILVSASNIYDVTVTDSNGCVGSANTEVVFYPPASSPVISIAPNSVLCAGETIVLNTDNTFSTYNWSSGETTNTISVTSTDNYLLTVTDANGCSATSQFNLEIFPLPDEPIVLQKGDTLLTTSSGNISWLFDGSIVSNSSSFVPNENGVYVAIVTDVNGCSASSLPYEYFFTNISNNYLVKAIYPNPVKDLLQIAIDQKTTLELFDISGKLHKLEIVENGINYINMTNLNAGIYILKASFITGEKLSAKVVKQ